MQILIDDLNMYESCLGTILYRSRERVMYNCKRVIIYGIHRGVSRPRFDEDDMLLTLKYILC